jgi:hypothetical protein
LEAATALTEGESDSAITGALASAAAATAARDILPKRIIVLLFCEVLCTRQRQLHNEPRISSIELASTAKMSQFIGLLHISYSSTAHSSMHIINQL